MNIGKSSLKIFGANTTAALANFAGVILFSRLLGGSLLGSFFLFEAVLGLLSIPSNFGIRDGVEKRVSEGGEQGAYLTAAIALKFIPLVVIGGLVVAFRGYLNDYLGQNLALLLVGVLFLQEYAHLALSILRGELRVGETAVLRVTRQVSWLLVGGGLVYYGFGVKSLVVGLAVGYGIMLCWGWYKVSIRVATPSMSHARSIFDYSKFSVISSLGGYFYSWMDLIVIGFFLSTAHVNAYEISWRVTMIVMLFSRALATTIFPQVSLWDADEAIERIESVVPTVLLYSLLFVIPAFFGTAVLSGEILELVFGVDLEWAWLVLAILMSEKILQAINVVIGRSLQALDKPELAARATVVAIGMNLVLNIVLVWQFGIVGAAVATTVSFFVNTYLHWKYLRKLIAIDVPITKVGWVVLASVCMWVVLKVVRLGVVVDSLLVLVAMILLGVGVYLGVLLSFRPLRTELVQRGRTILK